MGRMGRLRLQNFGAGQENGRGPRGGVGGIDKFMNFYHDSMKFYL